jgi:riboflavin-specific deaminase-like protein
MRQLSVLPAEVDAYDAHRPARTSMLRLNMIASADGAATDERGRTGDLGGPGDLLMFRALRAHADAILVGATTVRTEGYGPHRLALPLAKRRVADGRDAPAAIVVVTATVDLDLDAPLFTQAVTPTVVLTCAAAPAGRREAAAAAGRLLVVGEDRVDLARALPMLRSELGAEQVLCEGGPNLNGQLLAEGLVDELCLTVAPALLGGGGPRIVQGLPTRVGLKLIAAFECDGELYLRYEVMPP